MGVAEAVKAGLSRSIPERVGVEADADALPEAVAHLE